ncbi:MAG: hypothetical protein ACTHNE_07870 [Dyella sp.]|uniref:hypothetical protein n=1 Tax=Dyella sp. TaxID=1869338 RepID=UPI003F81BD80
MSQKIDDVLHILADIRSGYRSDTSQSVRAIRIRVIHQIANERNVDYQTIADAYIRRLAPELKLTRAFDHLVEQWLAAGSPLLQRVLEQHAIDHADPARIRKFFESAT